MVAAHGVECGEPGPGGVHADPGARRVDQEEDPPFLAQPLGGGDDGDGVLGLLVRREFGQHEEVDVGDAAQRLDAGLVGLGTDEVARPGRLAVLAALKWEDGRVDRGLQPQVVGALAEEADDVLGVGGARDDLDAPAEGGDLGARECVLAWRVGQGAQLALQQQRQLGDGVRGLAVVVGVVERELPFDVADLDGEVHGEVGQFVPEGLGDGAGRVGAALADDLDADQPGAGVDDGLHVPAVGRVGGQAGVALAGLALGVVDAQVEGLVGAGRVVVDGDAQAVAPHAGFLGVHLEDVALAVALGGLQRDTGGLPAAGLGDPDDHGDGAAVAEELVNGVADGALGAQSPEAALELGEAGDADRLVQRTAPGVAHEGGHRSGQGRDGAGAAGKLFDVDAGIRRLGGAHCTHRHSPSYPCLGHRMKAPREVREGRFGHARGLGPPPVGGGHARTSSVPPSVPVRFGRTGQAARL
ncbi:hypothetical protein STAFG_7281 [Streptomyces afghaniensis 772]|uniref:Uncharacterized protein n=1 Tax=Streptomyces afghaniensis 772 TaxID=1283301 RepID=S4MJ98_9ACTN|nr:hypothetical protein STAFG_7281 [Streptomyces afghaniensis 772]